MKNNSTKTSPAPKQYIGISRDHSASMGSLTQAAAKDYNNNIEVIKDAASENDVDTIVSVVRCGVGYRGAVEREVVNSNAQVLKPLASYNADGSSTPLFDSVGELIELLSAAPDAADPHVSFLVMAITDGAENSSKKWDGRKLGNKIRELQNTDHWTFVFRVPRGYASELIRLGIPAGNILEWEQTTRGLEQATATTKVAFKQYYKNVGLGVRNSQTFYANTADLSARDIRREMTEITDDVTIWDIKKEASIRDFVEMKLRRSMTLGCAFYQLTKPEKAVQDYKLLCIRNRKTGVVYAVTKPVNCSACQTSAPSN
jgi:hypothetical protein